MERGSTPKADGARAERRRKLALLREIHTKLTPSQIVLLRAAYPELFEEYQGTIFKRLKRRGLPDPMAEDALQEVFLALYNNIVDNGCPRSIPRMLHVIMKRRCSSYLRAMLRDPMSVGLPSSGSMPPGSTPDLAGALDLREIPRRFLRRLPPEQQAVVRLVRLQEVSPEEAAKALGIPVNTVISRLATAEGRLKALATTSLRPSERRCA